jgi:hypothetical protein
MISALVAVEKDMKNAASKKKLRKTMSYFGGDSTIVATV